MVTAENIYTNLEIADKVFMATDGNVWWFSHVVAAVKPFDQFTALRNHKYGRRHTIYCHYITCNKSD